MKTIITWTAVLVTLASLVFAAVPQTINYQGYLKDGSGAPVNGPDPVNMTFSIYSTSHTSSIPVWSEAQKIYPQNGIYSVQLGSQTPITAPFDKPYWLGVKVEKDAEMELQQLSSVPYSLRAGVADNATSISGQTLVSLDSRYNDPARPLPTSQQLATLRWDQVRNSSNTTPDGSNPTALAFDGSSVWVANYNSNSVQKINPASGAVGAPIIVGTNPRALAFDSNSLWVANEGSGSVQKINPATGVVGSPITVGTNPGALTYDGSSIWVANYANNSVQKINPVTNTTVGSAITVGAGPAALAFDGSSVWVANYTAGSIQRVNPATNSTVGLAINVGTNPIALAFDGNNIWVANFGSFNLMKINPTTGDLLATIGVGKNPYALAFDGNSIWVANEGNNSVQKINPTTGAVSSHIPVGTTPAALAFDGSNIWVANNGSNSLTKLSAAAEPVGVLTVGTGQLVDGALTANKLADGAVTSAKIADGAVNDAKISGPISAVKLNLSTVVAKAGGTMTGPLILPVNGLNVGSNELVVSGGNVGIGTISPASTLTVAGTIESTSGGIKFPDGSVLSTAKSDCSGDRYEDNNDGTVSDCRTGLIWHKNASCSGFLTWSDARSWAASLSSGGACSVMDGSVHGDWRLPTKTELMAMLANARKQGFTYPPLTDRTGTAQWTQGDLFTNVDDASEGYWTNTTSTDAGFLPDTAAWYVEMTHGLFYSSAKAIPGHRAWAVRSGQ
jgi:YVTN family beta-propeller protein